jgi:hypothetical protein
MHNAQNCNRTVNISSSLSYGLKLPAHRFPEALCVVAGSEGTTEMHLVYQFTGRSVQGMILIPFSICLKIHLRGFRRFIISLKKYIVFIEVFTAVTIKIAIC